MADAPGGIVNDWQDKRILYARAEISLLFGKILLKCTLGQAFLAKLAYFVRFLLEKSCPRVHFANILPESGLLAAQGYKIRVFCRTSADAFIRAYSTNHSGAFLPTTSYAFAH